MSTNNKILIVEDEKETCALMKKVLERDGIYSVFTTDNGAEAKKLCAEELPNLIFLDYFVTDTTGDKIIQFLKSNPKTAGIPIVLTSGLGEMTYAKDQDRWVWAPDVSDVTKPKDIPDMLKWRRFSEEVAESFGVMVYLRKPFSKTTLLNVTRSIIGPKPKNESGE